MPTYLEAKRGQPAQANKMLAGSRTDQGGERKPEPPVIRPEVQALAAKLNVDLATVTGTGLNGIITKADVRKAAQPTHSA